MQVPPGFVLGRGPVLHKAACLQQGHILDLARTLLSVLGVDAPADFEGRPWSAFTAPA